MNLSRLISSSNFLRSGYPTAGPFIIDLNINFKNKTMEANNKATSIISLWINNDESLYKYWTNQAKDLESYELSQKLKDYFAIDNYPFDGASAYSDLLTMALSQVDWLIVAKDLKE